MDDGDNKNPPEKIFDISEDLKMSPITEDAANPANPVPSVPVQKTPQPSVPPQIKTDNKPVNDTISDLDLKEGSPFMGSDFSMSAKPASIDIPKDIPVQEVKTDFVAPKPSEAANLQQNTTTKQDDSVGPTLVKSEKRSIPLMDIDMPNKKPTTNNATVLESIKKDYSGSNFVAQSSEMNGSGMVANTVAGNTFNKEPNIANQPQFSNIQRPVEMPASPNADVLKDKYKSVEDPDLKALKTYEGDVAKAMSTNRVSKASIAIAESRKNEEEDAIGNKVVTKNTAKKLILALLSLIILGGGVFGGYYLYSISPLANLKTPASQAPKYVSLIPSDSVAVIAIDGLTANQIVEKIRTEANKSSEPNTIKEIILTEKNNDVVSRADIANLIDKLDVGVPDTVIRTLTANWMLASYTDQNLKKSLFVVANTNYFQNAFAGMFVWEKIMADDLKKFIFTQAPYGISNTANQDAGKGAFALPDINQFFASSTNSSGTTTMTSATSTATSTKSAKTASTSNSKLSGNIKSSVTATSTMQATSTDTIATTTTSDNVVPYFTLRGGFEDKVIRNKDVREFVTVDGNILFLYSFIDSQKLVVSSSEQALSEIVNRLERQVFIR